MYTLGTHFEELLKNLHPPEKPCSVVKEKKPEELEFVSLNYTPQAWMNFCDLLQEEAK